MPTIIYCGEFGQQLGTAIAARIIDSEAKLLNLEQFRAHSSLLQGQVFALFSALRLDLMQEVELKLALSASLFSSFAFERHVLLAPPSSADGVCAACFSKRILSHPPAPYSAESLFFLAKLGTDLAHLEFQGFHPGIVGLAAQLCLLQANGQFAADHSILFEIGNTQIQSSKIMPFHGCTCRSRIRRSCAGPARFTAFHQELNTWIS